MSIRTSLLTLCLIPLGCGGAVETSRSSSTADLSAEVQVFLEAYMDAIAARDSAMLRAQVADSTRYVWAEDGSIRYRSVDGMLAGLGAFPADIPIETDLSELHVAGVGVDGAHAAALFETRIGAGEGAFAFGGLITFVLERADETWRIVGGHASSAATTARRAEPQRSNRE